jgi:hydrogenase 3 maturation protease
MPSPHKHRQRPLRLLLRSSLRQARNIAVVGIGSDLRGDDAAGILVIRELEASLSNPERAQASRIRLFDGGTAPENLTGEILRFKPTHILLVDAADLGMKPGTIKLLDPEQIGGITFSTHVLPLKVLTDYLQQSHPCQIVILGIQPGSANFGQSPSPEIKLAAHELAREIRDAANSPR